MPEHILSGIKAIVAMKLRREGKLQKEIAEYLNTNRTEISHYLQGRHPSKKVLRTSQEILNLPPQYAVRIINTLSDDKEITSRIIKALYRVEVEVEREKCILCGECLECPYGAVEMGDFGVPVVNPERCRVCGRCTSLCPTGALKLIFLKKKMEE
ncbi:MAG TPA: 4Fe-4S dicluster domain-containing protein [Methanothermococcus okinawensis]|uniref:4Fe-4S dicluster domain-containing protein n=1 Tax=Methanothermococcus okinawensis TaxID=155863 RepID=A0A832ZZ75_9EURY|nr:4Fe-4S dicluster domain-containing protein [Methanothermococcus okinawensis]